MKSDDRDNTPRVWLIENLRRVPLFAELPDDAMEAIAERLQPRRVPAGETIFSAGSDVATATDGAFYLVESGEVRVAEESECEPMSILRQGDFYGEMVLLSAAECPPAARVTRDANLWLLYRPDFEDLLTQHPAISMALNRALSRRLVAANRRFHGVHLRRVALFRGLNDAQLDDLSHRLKAETAHAGDVICQEGAEGERLWLIESGQVEVSVRAGHEAALIETLGAGDFFGETALLTGTPQPHTLKALTNVELWTLPKDEFDRLLLRYPSVAIALSQSLSRRLEQTEEQLAGATEAGTGRSAAAPPVGGTIPARPGTLAPALPEGRWTRPTAAPSSGAAVPRGGRPSPAFGLQRVVVGALQSIQESAEATATWFGERSVATKLRLVAVVLLIAWLIGITIPSLVISQFSARQVRPTDLVGAAMVDLGFRAAEFRTTLAVGYAPQAAQGQYRNLIQVQTQNPKPKAVVVREIPVAAPQAPAASSGHPVQVVFGGGKPPATEQPTSVPTPTPLPAATSVPPTPTAERSPFVRITTDTVNVRSGPGVVYDRLGEAKQDEEYVVLAKSGDGWFQIEFGGAQGWISADFVQGGGAQQTIALAQEIPPPPTPQPAAPAPAPAAPAAAAASAASVSSRPALNWDGRLDVLKVKMLPAAVAAGQPAWRLVEARWADENESQGKHHIYVNVLDENGQRIVGQPVLVEWSDGQAPLKTEDKPKNEYACNFQMYNVLGSYNLSVQGLPSDKVVGLGMGTIALPNYKYHTSFYLTFQRCNG